MGVEALSYAIDHQDRVIKVSDGFYRFGEENGWDRVGDTLGRSLWDFVAGEQMRKLQRLLLRRIRDEESEVELPFRCDSPAARREMDIRISARNSGRAVLFSARVRSEEKRETAQPPLLDPKAPRGGGLLQMCGWCDRFEVAGEWVEVETATARLRLFARKKLPTVSHGICPKCSELLLAA